MGFTVTYSGITDKSIGCHAKSRPSVPAPVQKVKVSELAGRDGGYYDVENVYGDIAIQITFSFSQKNKLLWHQTYRAIKNWLLSGDNGDLKFSDDVGFHYRVKNVQIDSTDRIAWTIGEVTATFICDGYTYLDSGDTQINLAARIQNDYALCMPIYDITGNGAFTLTVNSKSMTGTVSTNLTIDTERMLAIQNGSTWVNTTVSGDYQDLWLKPGLNLLSITNGMTCKIKPQWRCL